MPVKTFVVISLVIIALGMDTAIVNAESNIKNAESITKDLVVEQKSESNLPYATGTQPVKNRGIKIVPVAVGQEHAGSGRTALSVEFDYDSDILTQNAKWQLDELAQALNSKALTDYSFTIIGHTDSVGSDEYNMGLSKRRAFSVVQYLNGTHRVSANRLYAEGMGERQLADSQNPSSGVNRRVEVRNLGGQ